MIIALWAIIALSAFYLLRCVWNAFIDDAAMSADIASSEETEAQRIVTAETRKSVYQQNLGMLQQQQTQGEITAEAFAALKAELDRQLIRESQSSGSDTRTRSGGFWPIFASVAAVVALSIGYFYVQWQGEPRAWLQDKSAVKAWIAQGLETGQPPEAALASAETYQQYLRVLHAKTLSQSQSRPESMKLLATSYESGGLFDLAAGSYEQLLSLPEQDTHEHSSAYVHTSMMANGGQLTQPLAQRLEVLFRRPEGPSLEVLYLLGLGAFTAGNYEIALTSWRPVLASYPENSPAYADLRAKVAQAESSLAIANLGSPDTPASTATTSPSPVTKASAAPLVQVSVDLSDTIQAKLQSAMGVDDGMWLVVYAKTAEMPMPVAVSRVLVGKGVSWPQTVPLSDADALMPERLLSAQGEIVVGARLARTEDMRARAGDFQAEEVTLSLTPMLRGKPLSLTLSSIIE